MDMVLERATRPRSQIRTNAALAPQPRGGNREGSTEGTERGITGKGENTHPSNGTDTDHHQAGPGQAPVATPSLHSPGVGQGSAARGSQPQDHTVTLAGSRLEAPGQSAGVGTPGMSCGRAGPVKLDPRPTLVPG